MADHTTRIAEIEQILRAGARRVTHDGVTIDYDFDALRSELRKLKAADPATCSKRPVASRLYLGGF